MNIYHLQSAAFVYAPRLIAWAINGAKFPADAPVMVKVVKETWPKLPAHIAEGVVLGRIAYKVENETVIIEEII